MLYAIPFLATCGAVMNNLLPALRAEFIGRTQRASALRAKLSHDSILYGFDGDCVGVGVGVADEVESGLPGEGAVP